MLAFYFYFLIKRINKKLFITLHSTFLEPMISFGKSCPLASRRFHFRQGLLHILSSVWVRLDVIHPQSLSAADSEERHVLVETNVLFITQLPRSFLKTKKTFEFEFQVCCVCLDL
jgi:hypothetical protein